jgi:RecA-family ATPase
VFAGDENTRTQVRAFITALRGLALKYDLAVVLLAHPSVAGMASGTGTSGSTGWSNSARSRLYFERMMSPERIELDPNLRLLTNKKQNYGAVGNQIRVRWCNGVFTREGDAVGVDKLTAMKAAEQVFLDILRSFAAQGREVSHKPSSSYAPKIFAAHPKSCGIKNNVFALAMNRLIDANAIHIETYGPPSRHYSKLVIGPRPASLISP